MVKPVVVDFGVKSMIDAYVVTATVVQALHVLHKLCSMRFSVSVVFSHKEVSMDHLVLQRSMVIKEKTTSKVSTISFLLLNCSSFSLSLMVQQPPLLYSHKPAHL